MDYPQLRKDLVSGDWIVIAPHRRKREHKNNFKFRKRKIEPIKGCPLENPQKSGNGLPIILYPKIKNSIKKNSSQKASDWRIQLIKNKYPALLSKNIYPPVLKEGIYSIMPAIGHHELVITRDHNNNFSEISLSDAVQVFKIFQERYKMIAKENCTAYISVFHNWGPGAGASVYHPHYQIISIPVVPLRINRLLKNSYQFFRERHKCVQCAIIDYEKKNKKRVIFENESAIALAPFFSEEPYEVQILPKRHTPCFEDMPENDLRDIVKALQAILKKITKNLHDPDYNFYIQTAPVKNKEKHDYFHWHIEIRPKISIMAGFELNTGMEINVVSPEEAAELLRD